MNHQPFEDLLLNAAMLTPQQKRELDSHLRACSYCTALVKSGRVLQSLTMASPANGFVPRFQVRLEAEKSADRKRRIIGSILLVTVGSLLLSWLASPFLAGLFVSPAGWIDALVEWGGFVLTTLLASIEAGVVILNVLGGFLSPFAWMVAASGVAGISLVWSVSIWRFVRVPQGV